MKKRDTIKLNRRIVENSLPILKTLENHKDILLLVQEVENVVLYDFIAGQQENAFKSKNFEAYEVLKEERQKQKMRVEEFREKALPR